MAILRSSGNTPSDSVIFISIDKGMDTESFSSFSNFVDMLSMPVLVFDFRCPIIELISTKSVGARKRLMSILFLK